MSTGSAIASPAAPTRGCTEPDSSTSENAPRFGETRPQHHLAMDGLEQRVAEGVDDRSRDEHGRHVDDRHRRRERAADHDAGPVDDRVGGPAQRTVHLALQIGRRHRRAPRHPSAPHQQGGPPGSTMTWASDPALPWAPCSGRPRTTTADSTVTSTTRVMKLSTWRASPIQRSPAASALAGGVEHDGQPGQVLQVLAERERLPRRRSGGRHRARGEVDGTRATRHRTILGASISSGAAASTRRTSCSSTRHTSRVGVLIRSRTRVSPASSTIPADNRTGSITTARAVDAPGCDDA